MNLIFSAFAVLDGHREGANANLGRAAYDRGIVVALASARAQNPDCAAALVTNAPVPEPYAAQLAAAGVEVLLCPFDAFRFPPTRRGRWRSTSSARCGGCSTTPATSRYLLLDADTYTQRPFADLWREADEAVLLYQVEHPASQPMAAAIMPQLRPARARGRAPLPDPFRRRAGGGQRRASARVCRALRRRL